MRPLVAFLEFGSHRSIVFPTDRTCILKLPPPSDSATDKLFWHWSPNGSYSIKSSYKLIMNRLVSTTHLEIDADWQRIWKTNIPYKARFFVWRVLRGIIPARGALQKRGLQISALCSLCNRNTENTWHVFVGCPYVSPVWTEATLGNVIDNMIDTTDSFSALVFRFLKENPHPVGDRFLMILWSVWHRRNDILWNDGPRDPVSVIKRANSILSE
ncbi:hypothetical protein L6452_00368 [Arctium lappa]|uniref:Uncharacterized protein n=1 Tax=Arctium lappa TaxID=4217 RepID=A0ACB9FDY1_ARCLA|nr:hypothetical protein L6452_00368 [Arctium lappa]